MKLTRKKNKTTTSWSKMRFTTPSLSHFPALTFKLKEEEPLFVLHWQLLWNI